MSRPVIFRSCLDVSFYRPWTLSSQGERHGCRHGTAHLSQDDGFSQVGGHRTGGGLRRGPVYSEIEPECTSLAFTVPASDRKLSTAEIAEMLIFIRNSWGNHAGAVSEGAVGDVHDTLGSSWE